MSEQERRLTDEEIASLREEYRRSLLSPNPTDHLREAAKVPRLLDALEAEKARVQKLEQRIERLLQNNDRLRALLERRNPRERP